ncbi:CAMK family protein kinase [Trichomonas vaginalis G3]|uniref:CAMK family protein kinase n=1 Tax=Trichomonas vaginalis (strain ATCC PRA-98 / G3) TaxID=412133 RepID=A2G1R6_TRIV3|nr:protein serine/threonine kinase protein [Trichomonas vaginalis G3]EAX88894.1 CAMK family protein kinase [Trichomonas vaginalis G3]KAI5528823.1 protein serine/threonine kinase protein [Trichomonas vaginalis G3]|eukprot:XP_001301824.1 CAMK family protein kinase [Trichomonas vaginalis G3]
MFDEMVFLLDKHGYIFKRQIGKGCFATCYLVYDQNYQQEFICKVCHINSSKEDSSNNIQFYQNEIDALIKVSHPNIVNIYNHFTENNYMFIILEYCKNQSLDKYINLYGIPQKAVLFEYVKQFAQALQHCHSMGMAHHDIKPANLLLDEYNRIKLADFGFASFDLKTNAIRGSLAYIPPEKLGDLPYDPFASDVWSFGVTLYNLNTGKLPFPGSTKQEMEERIKKAEFKILPEIYDFAKTIIEKTIVFDPAQRWTMNDIVNYLANYKNKSKMAGNLRLNSKLHFHSLNQVCGTGRISAPYKAKLHFSSTFHATQPNYYRMDL